MYIAPASHQAIGANSISPSGVKRVVQVGTNNAIKVPLVFQYRCSDYLKYIGGFRAGADAALVNIGYTKRMGFDIGLKTETFSFDVEISAQYDKETALVSPTTSVTQTAAITA